MHPEDVGGADVGLERAGDDDLARGLQEVHCSGLVNVPERLARQVAQPHDIIKQQRKASYRLLEKPDARFTLHQFLDLAAHL
jgi:hypothetical protein